MMAEVIRQAERIERVEHYRSFEWRRERGSGFGFPCAADGTVEELAPAARENLRCCLDGSYAVVDHGVRTHRWVYIQSALLRCDCGGLVTLDGFTNSCPRCGADYNMSGMRLAPREQWGEEDGSTASEILMYGGAGRDDYWDE